MHEAHDRLFKQLSIKSYPKPTEHEDWKEMIHYKNQLFLIAQGNPAKVVVGQDEEAGDAFVLQEASVKSKMQSAGNGRDVSESLGDSEGEAEPVVESWATRWTRVMVVETSEFEPEEWSVPTKKRMRAHTSKASKSSTLVAEPNVVRNKQKASRPQATKKPKICKIPSWKNWRP